MVAEGQGKIKTFPWKFLNGGGSNAKQIINFPTQFLSFYISRKASKVVQYFQIWDQILNLGLSMNHTFQKMKDLFKK